MKVKFIRNWNSRKAGEVAELDGAEAVDALREKAAQSVATKPSDRAEKRPAPDAERR